MSIEHMRVLLHSRTPPPMPVCRKARIGRAAHQRGFLAASCSCCHSFSRAAPVRPPTVELLAACSESAARQGAPSGL